VDTLPSSSSSLTRVARDRCRCTHRDYVAESSLPAAGEGSLVGRGSFRIFFVLPPALPLRTVGLSAGVTIGSATDTQTHMGFRADIILPLEKCDGFPLRGHDARAVGIAAPYITPHHNLESAGLLLYLYCFGTRNT
jgi:hypothetical protein